MEVRPAISLEFVRVASSAVNESGAVVNPTVDAVAFAFVTEGTPVTALTPFITGSWETDNSDAANPIYYARVLVGPAPNGAYIPTAGTSVDTYIRVTDNPEAPIRRAGTIRFT